MISLKTPEQIKRIAESCRLLAILLDSIPHMLEPGMTTRDIDSYCHQFIVRHHGRPAFLDYMGFPGSACISINEEVIHGIPGKRKIKEGDLVSIDLGIDLDGYYSDSARTFIIGQTKAEYAKLVQVTEECLYLGIKGAQKNNARIHDISAPIYHHADSHGYGVVRDYCGHGVGLAVHEEPQVPNYVSPMGANPRLRPGMVLAVEPMINLGSKNIRNLEDGWTVVTADGKPSAHFEHTIAITEQGVEILTVSN
jgi:methionyl aminopeptidase